MRRPKRWKASVAWSTIARAARSRSCAGRRRVGARSEEHTSELQSRFEFVCRLLLEKKKLMTGTGVVGPVAAFSDYEAKSPTVGTRIDTPAVLAAELPPTLRSVSLRALSAIDWFSTV